MMLKISKLLGSAAVVTATNSWNDGVPSYAAKKGGASAARDLLQYKLKQTHKKSAKSTELEQELEQVLKPPKILASVVPRFFVSAASDHGSASQPLPAAEHETLTALYRNMGGPDWHIKDGWMSASNPCGGDDTVDKKWFGVECTTFETVSRENSTSHVTRLALPYNNLVGELPALYSLQHLIHLDFSNPSSPDFSDGFSNSVGGTLDALCGLSDLSTVLLAGNNLTGSIPGCIQSLANTVILNLNYNAIQGTTPAELCYLHGLEELHLRGNCLDGTVPECFGEDLTALRALDYSNIDADLILGNQSLTGTLPNSLCNLERLESLQFQATQGLTGTLPDCLGAKQPELRVFALEMNQFRGPIPDNICLASTLELLNLFENILTGTLPICLGSLSQLGLLDVSANQFHGSIPEELCQASAFEILHLNKNALTGTIPSCLGSLSKLTELELNHNNVHGSIPKELCESSALEYLYLNQNTLKGTIPSCLGSISQLTELKLNQNNFHGPISEELCEARALKHLQLNDNSLTGTLPSCLATSFLLIEAVLLYNNDFTGTLPSLWASPSLMSIMLSNNPKLSGSLPTSLFLQQTASNATRNSTSSNSVLRAVVIEGTLIGGTIPATLCSAQYLQTLAVSGNEITGSLPDCVASLRKLRTLRASNNHLTGTLPEAFNNMTSLAVLDLATNHIQGRVPAGLGDISQNLSTVLLHSNRLSCDLPTSVLDWHESSADATVNLLNGNLFGCSTDALFALSIQGALGLRNVNEQAFDAYSCGNSNYVLPAITVAILAAPIVVWLAVLYLRARLALHWRGIVEWMVNPTTLIHELDHADRQIRALALGVIAAATMASSLALELSFNVAKSSFECEYMATSTLANKQGSNMRVLSIGVGAGACIGLMLGLVPWWRRLVSKWSTSTNAYSGIIVEINKPLYPLEEDAEAWGYEAERIAEASTQKPPTSSAIEAIVRALKLVVLILALVILTIGPNVGYILVVLSSQLTQQQKVASEMAVIVAKTAIVQVLVPRVALKAVDLLVLNGALTFVRFRLRLTIAAALSAMSMIVLPMMTQFLSDPRCLYYIFDPQPAVDTAVPISTCALSFDKSFCIKYATSSAISTFKPRFTHDSGVCMSAILSVYAPVFLGVVLLAATVPAGMETIIVPWLAPWCYRNAKSSTAARAGLAFLRMVTWNVWPTLADAGLLPPDFSLGAAKVDYLARRVVERAFAQVMPTLLVALTFGSGVPVLSGACAVAAFVQLLHHRHVLGQIVGLGRLEQPAVVPNLMGCTDVPFGCAVVLVVTVAMVSMWGALRYLEPIVIGCMIFAGLCVGMVACGIIARWKSDCSEASRHVDRAQSTASLDTSQGMLMESLLSEDATRRGANSS
jgi:Leucine-rich repeat (LRR) protein